MIYAIRAVGTEFIKFGKAGSVGRRMKELDTGCPHELSIEAVGNWPDGQETAIHAYLRADCEKNEWFRDSLKAQAVIGWLNDKDNGLEAFKQEFSWRIVKPVMNARVAKQQPRVSTKPVFDKPQDTLEAYARFDHIKRMALGRG